MGMNTACERTEGASPRLAFLDGLRGLTALYVVLHHAALNVSPEGLAVPAAVFRFFFRHGHAAVSVFAVLSGFSLMLGVVAKGDGYLPGGTLRYLQRRARRILPPYYGALALAWLLAALVPAFGHPGGTPWDRALPAFEPGAIASHLLMIHNLHGHWFYRVAPSFWSVATEWQLYMLFPLLLFIWRDCGVKATVAVGFGVGSMLALLSLPLANPALRKLCPWYLGLFALGMAAAASRVSRPGSSRAGLASMLAIAASVLTALVVVLTDDGYVMLADIFTGALTASLLMWWLGRTKASRSSSGLRLLESRWAVALGACSYTLYLVHYPFLSLGNIAMRDWGWTAEGRLAGLMLVVAPLCVLAAQMSARVFERPPSRSLRSPQSVSLTSLAPGQKVAMGGAIGS